jgi:hypothetical protein
LAFLQKSRCDDGHYFVSGVMPIINKVPFLEFLRIDTRH